MHPFFLPRFVALATFKMPETGYTKTVGYDKILTTEPECAGKQKNSGAPVIGGADRATGIWVVRPSGPWLPLLLTAGAGLAAVAGLWKTRKK